MASLQWLATIVMMGALQTAAMDILELHMGILPMQVLLHKVCF